MLPAVVGHADWSVSPKKRWLALATRRGDGRYQLSASQPVGPLGDWLARFGKDARGGQVLLGFDFPIGIPAAYAIRAGISAFTVALAGFNDCFYAVAEQADEISLCRPFYPMRPGGTNRQLLLDGLGLPAWSDLLRRCDRGSATRPPACALFWTLGGNQVGKAAISGWRDLLAPALRADADVALWPFGGRLDELLARHNFVVAETYPAEVYRHLGVFLGQGGKGSQSARRRVAQPLLAKLRDLQIDVGTTPRLEIEDGFGDGKDGEDRFDAVVGLVGMLQVVFGQRASGEPDDPIVRSIEGWILGQSA